MTDMDDPPNRERPSVRAAAMPPRKADSNGRGACSGDERPDPPGKGAGGDGKVPPRKERPSIRLAELHVKESRKNDRAGEIDNLYDELFKTPAKTAAGHTEKAARNGGKGPLQKERPSRQSAPLSVKETGPDNPVGEIDYLYDELFKISGGGDEEYTGGEWPIRSLTLEYLDGSKKTAAKAVLFRPAVDTLTLEGEGKTADRMVPLADLACIRLTAKPPGLPADSGLINTETIDIGEGVRYKVSVPEKQYAESCLYGYATDRKTFTNEYFFFPYRSIKQRCQNRYLGEIITHLGLLTRDEVEQAVEEQRQRRKRRLGEIVAEVAKISPRIVEHTIQRAFKRNTRLRVGEILVKSGVVDEDMVHEALVVQKHLRQRLGEMLFEGGLLSEEQLFRVLAEKFSMPYVDLRQEKFAGKALAAMPKEMAVKLSLLPINFTNTNLVVATIFPDITAIKGMVRQHTKRRDIKMVLARPSQLRAAIKKFYG